MGGTDKKGMENQKVRSIAEQLSRVQGELTDATANAEKAVRQLRWVWEGDDATTFFNAWPTTRHSLDLSTGGVDELAKKLREEVGEQELTSGVSGTGGDSDGDGIPNRDDQDGDNDGTPDDKDEDDDNNGVPDDRDDDPEDDDDQDDDGVDDNSDDDDDNDGIPDDQDDTDDNDSDDDGVPDRDDVDDDNDGTNDEDEPGEHRDGEGVWDKSEFDTTPEVNVGMTLAQGETQLWDEQVLGHTWGDEDGNHISAEVLGTEGKADYEAGISKDGLVASGGVMAGAYVAKVSGSYANSYGTQAEGKAYVGAEANADAGVKLGLDGAKANVGGEVFVGGKAEASVSQDLGPVDVGAGGEISYGIGAHAEADAEISSDNIGVSVDIGATLGIGGGIKLDIGFDPPW
jgi:uncharacterized protein YukE